MILIASEAYADPLVMIEVSCEIRAPLKPELRATRVETKEGALRRLPLRLRFRCRWLMRDRVMSDS